MYKQIQKVLDWGVKFASLAITGPATWVVATELFADIQSPVLLFVMKFSALLLIEGVLLSNWLLLEFDRNATPEIKARYALTALAMYIALLVVGVRHEGFTGIVFRVALLAALLGSGWDTFVYTWQRATRGIDRSVANSRRVKAHARKLAVREAKTEREAEHAVISARVRAENEAELALIGAEHEVKLAKIGVERSAGLRQMELYGERLKDELVLDDREERTVLARREEKISLTESKSGVSSVSAALLASGSGNDEKKDPSRLSKNTSRSASRPADVPMEDYQLKLFILDAFGEDPSTSKRQLSSDLEISAGKVSRLVRELINEGELIKDGRNHYVMEEDDSFTPQLGTNGTARNN